MKERQKQTWQIAGLESDKELGHVLWQKSREHSHFLALALPAQFTHHVKIYRNKPSVRLTL